MVGGAVAAIGRTLSDAARRLETGELVLRKQRTSRHSSALSAGCNGGKSTVNGTCHAGDCLLRGALPEVYAATIRDINGFANAL